MVSTIQNNEESRVQKRDKETPGEPNDSSAGLLAVLGRACHRTVSEFNFLAERFGSGTRGENFMNTIDQLRALPASDLFGGFVHGGVWCCTEKAKCQWQGFVLHQGLAWGTVAGPTGEWKDRHNTNCRGRLIQLIPPNVERMEGCKPFHDAIC